MERFFGTLNTRLWSTLPGYVSSNTVERNPSAKAVLTLAELETRFLSFVDQYHQEEHSQLSDQHTPLSYWKQHCYAETVDPRQLDLLLLEAETRYVAKSGIRHRNTLYWHQALANYIGKYVLIRTVPYHQAPDEIEVFSNEQWVCTAFSLTSKTGQAMTAEDVNLAKRDQRRQARTRIEHAQTSLEAAKTEGEHAIESLMAASTSSTQKHSPQDVEEAVALPSDVPLPNPEQTPLDLLDQLILDEQGENHEHHFS